MLGPMSMVLAGALPVVEEPELPVALVVLELPLEPLPLPAVTVELELVLVLLLVVPVLPVALVVDALEPELVVDAVDEPELPSVVAPLEPAALLAAVLLLSGLATTHRPLLASHVPTLQGRSGPHFCELSAKKMQPELELTMSVASASRVSVQRIVALTACPPSPTCSTVRSSTTRRRPRPRPPRRRR